MLVNRIILSVLCAGALVVGEVSAGQSAEESQATQQPNLKRLVYSVDDLLKAMSIPDPKPGSDPAEKLIRLITSSIAPETWNEMGGMATIQYYPLGRALIVNQTQDNQVQIVDLLVALRQLQEIEVVVETRLLSMSPAMAKTFMSIAGFTPEDGDGPNPLDGVAFLNARQVNGWMEMFQGDRACNVMQAPKITGFNGQQVEIKVQDEVVCVPAWTSDATRDKAANQPEVPLGIHGKFLPVVSADQRFVRLNIDWCMAALDGLPGQKSKVVKLTFNKEVVLPSGGTVVCSLGKCSFEERETGSPPVLSHIPYLSRLFTNVGYRREDNHVFLMVTTRVIVNEGNKAAAVDGDCACPRLPR